MGITRNVSEYMRTLDDAEPGMTEKEQLADEDERIVNERSTCSIKGEYPKMMDGLVALAKVHIPDGEDFYITTTKTEYPEGSLIEEVPLKVSFEKTIDNDMPVAMTGFVQPADEDRRAAVVESLAEALSTHKLASYFIKDGSTPDGIEAGTMSIGLGLTFEPKQPEDK